MLQKVLKIRGGPRVAVICMSSVAGFSSALAQSSSNNLFVSY